MKNILVLCTGNSCRSIIAEAIINHELAPEVKAYSSGVAPSGRVMPEALELLKSIGISTSGLHSKKLDTLSHIKFDVVVTVCDHAKETCPVFPGNVKKVHVGIKDPIGLGPDAFEKVAEDVVEKVLPELQRALEQ